MIASCGFVLIRFAATSGEVELLGAAAFGFDRLLEQIEKGVDNATFSSFNSCPSRSYTRMRK